MTYIQSLVKTRLISVCTSVICVLVLFGALQSQAEASTARGCNAFVNSNLTPLFAAASTNKKAKKASRGRKSSKRSNRVDGRPKPVATNPLKLAVVALVDTCTVAVSVISQSVVDSGLRTPSLQEGVDDLPGLKGITERKPRIPVDPSVKENDALGTR